MAAQQLSPAQPRLMILVTSQSVTTLRCHNPVAPVSSVPCLPSLSSLQYSPLSAPQGRSWPETRGWCDHSSSDARIACLQIQAPRAERANTELYEENAFLLKRIALSIWASTASSWSWSNWERQFLFWTNDLLWLCRGRVPDDPWSRSSPLCSGQFKLSVIMMLAPAPDGPELSKLF